jgi:hypothetical protein
MTSNNNFFLPLSSPQKNAILYGKILGIILWGWVSLNVVLSDGTPLPGSALASIISAILFFTGGIKISRLSSSGWLWLAGFFYLSAFRFLGSFVIWGFLLFSAYCLYTYFFWYQSQQSQKGSD